MKKINLDLGWEFYHGEISVFASPNSLGWQRVNLPHDWSIQLPMRPEGPSDAQGAYLDGGIGNYRKTLAAPADWAGKRVVLQIGAAYQDAEIRLNGDLVCQHGYGYTTFLVDLTGKLRCGKDNALAIRVNNGAQPNARWYSGSGLYRHVDLLVGEAAHIAPRGVYVTTPKAAAEGSEVLVETTLGNLGAATGVTLEQRVLDEAGQVVARTSEDLVLTQEAVMSQRLSVAPAALWSLECPALYTLSTRLLQDGDVLDEVETAFGIRSIEVDAVEGFRLNGQPLKLLGGCVHHDNGPLGAASYDAAEWRKVALHKDAGFNAIRCAHNPPAEAMLDACDHLGILVIDEAFDYWREGKKPYDLHMTFDSRWRDDMRDMILRDRNHPCVIAWSTGNEIGERDGRSDGYAYSRKLADYARSLDATRFINSAICGIFEDLTSLDEMEKTAPTPERDPWGDKTEAYAAPLDIVGYNYLWSRYDYDGQRFPGRVICGTESKPMEAFDNWSRIERLPYVIGDFVWTSLDYLGESGIGRVDYGPADGPAPFVAPYPWHLAYCGDLDICGVARPQMAYKQILWRQRRTPYLAVYPPCRYGQEARPFMWAWPDVAHTWSYAGYESKPTRVDVYSSGDEVELILNGVSLGVRPCGFDTRYTASFDVAYEPGTLEAVSYVDGVETGRDTLVTPGPAAGIRLTVDRTALRAAYGDLAYVSATVVDEAGRRVPTDRATLSFRVEGVGDLAAVGTGNPVSEESYAGDSRVAFQGRALGIVRTLGEAGGIRVTVSALGLTPATVDLTAQ